jgi:MarR family transcriptional regulator, organic hydroperoxide resistance regulator
MNDFRRGTNSPSTKISRANQRAARSRNHQDIPIDPVLAFIRVMWSVDHELQRVSKRMVGSIGLTAPQRLALRFIGLYPGVMPGQLAELLHLHPGTVTGIVSRLETLALVARERSVEDTRRVHLRLSPAGQRLNRRRRGTVEAAVRRVAATVSAAQLSQTAAVMRLVASELATK